MLSHAREKSKVFCHYSRGARLVFPKSMTARSDDFLISSGLTPFASARIFTTVGLQKPP